MSKREKRLKRHLRVRNKVSGTQNRPRLSVFRSNKNIYAQLINDSIAKTLISASNLKLKSAKKPEAKNNSKIETAQAVGENLAKAALKLKIKKVVFDRGGYKYHGRIKALAESARKEGLEF